MYLPILYSYRRCPYAMRVRMALKLADIQVEIREVSLRDKPAHMLQISPKGTVPVLQLADGTVIEQSLAIMQYAAKSAALNPAWQLAEISDDLIADNDGAFKQALDGYKYPERKPDKTQAQHRADGEVFLQKLEDLLQKNAYLFGEQPNFADIAIFPFVRQFAAVDAAWFEIAPYPKLRTWLRNWVQSALFESVMQKWPIYQG